MSENPYKSPAAEGTKPPVKVRIIVWATLAGATYGVFAALLFSLIAEPFDVPVTLTLFLTVWGLYTGTVLWKRLVR